VCAQKMVETAIAVRVAVEQLDLNAARTPRDLTAVFGLRAATEDATALADDADVASILLGSLLDGHILSDGEVVELPLFGPRGCPVRLRLRSSPSTAAFRVQARATSFVCAADALALRPFPQSPLEWVASTVAEGRTRGREDVVQQAVALAWGHMCAPAVLDRLRGANVDVPLVPRASVGLVLTGAPGSGKSTVALAVAATMGRPHLVIKSSQLYSGLLGGTEQRVSTLVATAIASAPCTLILEDCDLLLSASPQSNLARRTRLLLLQAMDECAAAHVPLLWLACVADLGRLHPSALGPSRLAHVVNLLPLSPPQRALVLQPLLRDWLQVDSVEDLSEWTAGRTHGFSPADCTALVSEAARAGGAEVEAPASEERPPREAWCRVHLLSALTHVRASIALHAIGGLPRPVPSSSVLPVPTHGGGPDADALQLVRAAVLRPLEEPILYARLGCAPPTGVLLHGPPGTGKTMIAHAVAHEARTRGLAHALVVTGPDIISALVGSSEAALSAVFARARELAPCVLVLDNFEALAPARRAGASLGEDRLLSVLLTEMDGISGGAAAERVGGTYSERMGVGGACGEGGHLAALLAGGDPRLAGVLSLDGGGCGADAAPGPPLPLPSTASWLAFGGRPARPTAPTASVLVVAITRDVALLDAAVTRPGRLDVHVRTGVPAPPQRRAVLAHFLARSPIAASPQSREVLLDWLSTDAVSDGWSVADCEGVASASASRALRRHIAGGAAGEPAVVEADVRAAAEEARVAGRRRLETAGDAW
jgi:SpoVK/Ycf46/Vps4 family AAA+-type ATPase